eukprot:CAMPEP_0172519422 /NCGR_PEP_ID=MMETSP1066-20121228/291409_1 /TAXON_ID=671091 /ORGANISM="Coscinodiscus wailesii, Strain CCMP2513" /LENGTH=284 /DNA_ID=CAMNT_0013302009 /DNA_START=492 /DNA_END=1346 /DNA_ORIENTATION=+
MRCWLLFLIFSLTSEESHGHGKLRQKKNTTLLKDLANALNDTNPIIETNDFAIDKQYLSFRDFITSKLVTRNRRDLKRRSKANIFVNSNNIFAFGRQCKDAFTNQSVIKNVRSGAKNVLKLRGVQLSERFDGIKQIASEGTISMSDILTGNRAKNPLTLQESYNPRENLYVTKKCRKDDTERCRIEVEGRGPGGFKGSGAISILFHKDQPAVNLWFGADGAKTAIMKFYKRDGRLIETLEVDIAETTKYRFERREQSDIAGISVYPTGEIYEWHFFRLRRLCFS